jgi:acetyl esterase/lipase
LPEAPPRGTFADMKVGLLALFALSAARPLGAQGSRALRAGDIDTISLVQSGQRIAYGTDSLHFGELRLPANPTTPVPLAVIIHGGCFQASIATLRNSAPLADALAEHGVATWNIEYRRVGSPGGGWPGSFLDVAAATDYVRTLARLHPIDTARIVVAGHSAGGFFAVWLASRHGLSPRSPIGGGRPLPLRAAVSIGGLIDLAEFRRSVDTGCSRGVDGLLGGFPDAVPARLSDADPLQRLPFGIPVTHIAGESDPFGTLARREAAASAARRAGDRADVITVPGGHFEVMAPFTPSGRTTVDLIVRLLQRAP